MARTGYKAHPYKKVTEVFIAYGCKNDPTDEQPNAKVGWNLRLYTMRKSELIAFAKSMGISRPAMWVKSNAARYIMPTSASIGAECIRLNGNGTEDEILPRH